MNGEQSENQAKKKRRPMSEIAKAIKENRRKRPTKSQVNELFEILRDEGLAEPLDKAAKVNDPEASP